MKNKILHIAIFVSIVIISDIKAQKGFQLGAQWGPHISWLLNEDDMNNANFEYITTVRGAFHLNTQYGFTPSAAIGLSGLYSFEGQRYKLSGMELFKRVEYVKIPLVFIYTYTISENLTTIYKIGPQLGILTHASVTDRDGTDILSDQKPAYMETNFGGIASAGIGIELTNNFFLDIALRYDYGFTNAENEDYKGSINEAHDNTNGNGNGLAANRAMTNTMTAGIVAGVRFLFGNKE